MGVTQRLSRPPGKRRPHRNLQAVNFTLFLYTHRPTDIVANTPVFGSDLTANACKSKLNMRGCKSAMPSTTTSNAGLSMDGGMVNIRGEVWKKLKAGAVFDVAIRLERAPRRVN